jgi:hypothetical protein
MVFSSELGARFRLATECGIKKQSPDLPGFKNLEGLCQRFSAFHLMIGLGLFVQIAA